jgi:ribose/xylose/arabinose/galactoside ABC-type transport system permease subunit
MTRNREVLTGEDAIKGAGSNLSKEGLLKILSRLNVILLLVVLIVVFSAINSRFFTFQNLQFILKQSSILLIASVGGTFIILMGSIDLSVGGVASLTCISSAILANYHAASPLVAPIVIMEGLAIGLLFGIVNGLILVKWKIPSFLATLGVGTIAGGISLLLTGGFTVPTFTRPFKWLGSGNILGLPVLGIAAAVVYLVCGFVGNRTRFGKYIFAIGGGELATKFSGVPVDRVKVMAFALTGALFGLSGSLLAARLGAGSAVAADGLVLDVIAAVVMSGTSLTGGVGNVYRTVFGVLIITVLGNGLNIIGVSPHVQVVIKGIIVIVAVFTTIDRSRITIMK